MLPKRVVYCPKCKRKVMEAVKAGTAPVSVKCKNCNILVVFHPDINRTTYGKVPERNQSSGKRFY